MATEQHTGPATLAAAPDRPVIYERFQWHLPSAEEHPISGLRALSFAGRTMEVARGVATVLEILHRDQIEAGIENEDGKPEPRMIGVPESGDLTRLCIASLALLGDSAEELIDYANRQADAAATK